jgi:hypothetical protein
MLDEFEAWFMANALRLRNQSLNAIITRPLHKTDKSAIYADIDTEYYLARITLWESGEYDEEVLDARSGVRLHWKHTSLRDVETLRSALVAFCDRLSEQGFGTNT